jgi:hypothetical protein
MNLNSVCMTPQAHRHELLEYTHMPELRRVLYTPLMIENASLWGETQKVLIEAYGTKKDISRWIGFAEGA